jgi:uncharacterized protein (TIGR03086 family)
MDAIERIEKATGHTSTIVHGVKDGQLGDQTPCSEFDVRALLNHMIGGLDMLNIAASGGKATRPEGDQFGAEPGKDYDERRARLLETLRSGDVVSNNWEMPFGSMPGQMMAGIAFVEHVTHGWDLAKATGQDTTIPEHLVDEALGVVTPMDQMWRMPGVCGPKIEIPDSASKTDQFAGFMGRQP